MKVIIRLEGDVFYVYRNRNWMIQHCTAKWVEVQSASQPKMGCASEVQLRWVGGTTAVELAWWVG